MKSITLNSGEFLLVEVPDDASDFKIYDGMLDFKASFGPIEDVGRLKQLTPGNWQIVGKCSDLSEDDWKGILPLEDLYWEMKYRIHPLPGQELEFEEHVAESATQSGHSLIASHKMKPETTLILKKI